MTERIVLDTNVRISALLYRGTPGELVLMLRPPLYLPVVSNPLLRELEVTLARRFGWPSNEMAVVSANILANSLLVAPDQTVEVCRDPDDNRVLECALASKASAIITGDRDLLTLNPFLGIPILTVRQFLDRIRPSLSI